MKATTDQKLDLLLGEISQLKQMINDSVVFSQLEFTVHEAALYLKFQSKTIRNLLHMKELQGFLRGSKRLFKKTELDAYKARMDH